MDGLQAVKQGIKKLPWVGPAAVYVYRRLFRQRYEFNGSGDYWEQRYRAGGNSGDGSYRALAEFKAEVLNAFVEEKGVNMVIEYGCGDGNQLKLATYPSYLGFDVSEKAVALCRQAFQGDPSRAFRVLDEQGGEQAELTLSLDVIYHLVEDAVFESYMARLFDSATAWVIVYSSNTDDNAGNLALHVRHRCFTDWVAARRPQWELEQYIKNRYPYKGDNATGSFADFFIFRKR